MGVQVRQKVGSPYWWVFILHNGKRTSKMAADKRAANKLAEEIRRELALDDLGFRKETEAEGVTFTTYAEGYLEGAEQSLKRSTWIDYETNVRLYLIPAFGDRTLDKITRTDIKQLAIALRRKGKKAKTARKIVGTLSAILSEALDDNLITTNPALGLRKVYRSADFVADGTANKINPLTREELTHLLKTAREHTVQRKDKTVHPFRSSYPFLLLLARTGLRLGEALALQWGDIDWRGSFIEVQRAFVRSKITTPKNGKTRRVDMSTQLHDTLRELYTQRFGKVVDIGGGSPLDALVFPDTNGKIIDPDRFRRTKFKQLLKAAELRHIRIHDLRHTYASLLIEARKELHYIQQQLGHHSPAFTLAVYGHLLPRDRRGEVNCLDDVGAPGETEGFEERKAS